MVFVVGWICVEAVQRLREPVAPVGSHALAE